MKFISAAILFSIAVAQSVEDKDVNKYYESMSNKDVNKYYKSMPKRSPNENQSPNDKHVFTKRYMCGDGKNTFQECQNNGCVYSPCVQKQGKWGMTWMCCKPPGINDCC
ncbi:hypothetical protein EG328_000304 [Venturia inaequalis]|uniref:Uncharacterized protein n=2 Tax=Venturia inaequalis TaxID=5025 RepID=A0A8H3U5G7_VENIN|nr:hypothetical protein EG328_000304 [Venturia inaequalis]